MKLSAICGLTVVAMCATLSVAGDELKSGLQVGDSVGAFDVTKCGGAVDDGVEVGQKLCYR